MRARVQFLYDHRVVQQLDEELAKFARRRLDEPYPYLILDARYEKVREDDAVRSQAVLVAIGINWEGRRNILAVELANRESTSNWKELLISLQTAFAKRCGVRRQ